MNIKHNKQITEGGWDSTVTQGTVIHPSTVKLVLSHVEHFTQGLNQWLEQQDLPAIQVGHPTGSSAYYRVDPDDKVYGDVDLQMIAEPVDGTPSQFAAYYNRLVDQYIKQVRPVSVHYEDKPAAGHVIFKLGPDTYVQVDMIWTTPHLSNWMRYRMTPENNIKGLIYGNLYSSLGEIMGLAIQHSGVQMKVKDGKPINYQRGRKEDRIDTLTTDISRFAYDLLLALYERSGQQGKPNVSKRLVAHPGLNTDNIRILDLVQAIRGLAESFELNDMYGQGVLAGFVDSDDFIEKFLSHYAGKAQAAADATKFDKAATPEARARAKETKEKIARGLDLVDQMFKS